MFRHSEVILNKLLSDNLLASNRVERSLGFNNLCIKLESVPPHY